MTLTDCFVRFKCPTKLGMKTTWRIEAKTTHMVNHVIQICEVILGPHNVRNGSYNKSFNSAKIYHEKYAEIVNLSVSS